MTDASTVHREMYEVVQRGDFDGLRALYHADYVYMGTDGVEHKGAEAGVEVAQTYLAAFPDLAFEIRHQFTPNPTTSIIELTARGTHRAELEGIPATGRTVELVGCNVIEIQDGKIWREREYFDTLALMTQLGVELG